MDEPVSVYLADNLRQLRTARGFSQHQCARIAGIPRPTWSNLESGEANPTLAVLVKVAAALQVSVEELIRPSRAACRFFPAGSLPRKRRGGAVIQSLLPEEMVGMHIERVELQPSGALTGVPHTPGTREYLVCDSGRIELAAAGERWTLEPGDVVVFRGDQKHSYKNLGEAPATAYSVIAFEAKPRTI